MSVQPLDTTNLAANDETWEKILRKLSLGEMPPATAVKPPKELRAEFTGWLSTSLDGIAAQHPDPGLTVLRRLNRAEYANALRDLLDLKIDVSNELPADDSGHGFDNIAEVLTVSPTLMNRYIRVAGKVSRIAAGVSSRTPVTTDFRLVQDPYASGRASDEEKLGDSTGRLNLAVITRLTTPPTRSRWTSIRLRASKRGACRKPASCYRCRSRRGRTILAHPSRAA